MSLHVLEFDIQPQPDNTTCGPTCLHALYRFHGDEMELEQTIAEVPKLEEGGTLAVLLGCHALARGFDAHIITCNLQVFDPTWFQSGRRRWPTGSSGRWKSSRGPSCSARRRPTWIF